MKTNLIIFTLIFTLNLFAQDTYTKVPNENKKTKEQTSANGSEPVNQEKKIVLPPEDDGVGIAFVEKINGIDVYCMNIPLVPYYRAGSRGDLLSKLDVKSILFGGLSRPDASDKMNKLINAANKEAVKNGESFDAIIYTGGDKVLAINYELTEIPARLKSKVSKINGVYMYAFCEPENNNFVVVNEAKATSGGFTSVGSYGIINSNIDDDLKKMVERLDGRKKKKIDAVIYSSGKKGVGIKFDL